MVLQSTRDWFAQRIPPEWFTEPVDITADDDEILIVGHLPDPELPDDAAGDAVTAAAETRIDRFREDTREHRMAIDRRAQERYGRKVSWGATCGPVRRLFTTVSVPVMTRLRLPERHVLDTLIDSGVARSRSEALAWCVRQSAEAHAEWFDELRVAFAQVEVVRAKGPVSP